MLNHKDNFFGFEHFSDLKKWLGSNDNSLWPKNNYEQLYCYNFVWLFA